MKSKIILAFAINFVYLLFSFSQVQLRGSSSQLIQTIRKAFVHYNINIQHINILEIRTIKDDDLYTRGFLVLASGVRADYEYNGSIQDELFSLFQFDDSLYSIVKTFEFIPTPRWRDYNMWIDRVTRDSVYISGAGASYGDQPFTKGYQYLKNYK